MFSAATATSYFADNGNETTETTTDDFMEEHALQQNYEKLYRQIVSRTGSIGNIEKEVSAFNRAVLRYDRKNRLRNAERLAACNGLTPLFNCAVSTGNTEIHDISDLIGAKLANPSLPVALRRVVFAKIADALLSFDEADALCSIAHEVGYRPFVRAIPEATSGLSKREPRRTHTACSMYTPELAAWLWPRISPIISDFEPGNFNTENFVGRWEPFAINPCFRFLRYDKGQVFQTHTDDVYSALSNQPPVRSFLTVVIYLNDGFAGGELRFVYNRLQKQQQDRVIHSVAPRAGLAAVFQHDLLHEAMPPVGEVPKCIVRTDVLFRQVRGRNSKAVGI